MIAMPEPDRAVLARRAEIVDALRRLVPGEGVIDKQHELRAFESDGLTAYRQPPMVAVLPETTAQVVEVMRYCAANKIKVVPRGAGTSLSGGALPLADGVLLGMGKFNRILEIDAPNRCVVAQPGVTNLGITHAVQGLGLYYAPDPSSQIACTIGGNVAENSGGVHCLKYGLTTNNVIGIEMVTIDGEIVRLGGKHFDSQGYDLLGVMVGSEGMLGVVTEVTVRILPKPPGARALLIGFSTVEGAGDGNLHPLILYDANKPGELDRAEEFGSEILRLCVRVGGVLTGEHGVGIEKRDLMDTMFNEVDLNQQQRLKCAFDSDSLLNPGKVFPQLCRCAELGRMHVHAGKVAFPDLPRF